MKSVMDIAHRFNVWYDNESNTNRFWIFIGLIWPPILLSAFLPVPWSALVLLFPIAMGLVRLRR